MARRKIPNFIIIQSFLLLLVHNSYTSINNGYIDLKALNKKYRNTVVRIEFTSILNPSDTRLNPTHSERYSGRNSKGSHGSGFFISEYEIITNSHVVENARRGSIKIKSPASGNVEFKVEVVGLGRSKTLDLAILRLPKDEQKRFKLHSGLEKIPFLQFGDSDKLKQSDPLAVLGYPQASDELKIIQAEVTGRQYQNFGFQNFYIKHQFIEVGPGGVVQRGNSGGPVLNTEGKVIGIVSLGSYRATQGWLIPSNIATFFLKRVKKNKLGEISLRIPNLGIILNQNFPGTSVWSGAPSYITLFELGVVVREIHPKQQGAQWGLKQGDIIVGFANKQKNISCALDFSGYRVITGKMSKWPQDKTGLSNKDKPKLHLEEMIFTSSVNDDITIWYLRPEKGKGVNQIKLKTIKQKLKIDKQTILTHYSLYDLPPYELWGDFVAQDFNKYNVNYFNIPINEVLAGGALITYVEPNSLASHRGLEISKNMFGYLMQKKFIGEWYIVESINDNPVNNLKDLKKYLRKAEKKYQKLKKSSKYKAEDKILQKEHYVQIGIRTNSEANKILKMSPAFPIDEALECCRKK